MAAWLGGLPHPSWLAAGEAAARLARLAQYTLLQASAAAPQACALHSNPAQLTSSFAHMSLIPVPVGGVRHSGMPGMAAAHRRAVAAGRGGRGTQVQQLLLLQQAIATQTSSCIAILPLECCPAMHRSTHMCIGKEEQQHAVPPIPAAALAVHAAPIRHASPHTVAHVGRDEQRVGAT